LACRLPPLVAGERPGVVAGGRNGWAVLLLLGLSLVLHAALLAALMLLPARRNLPSPPEQAVIMVFQSPAPPAFDLGAPPVPVVPPPVMPGLAAPESAPMPPPARGPAAPRVVPPSAATGLAAKTPHPAAKLVRRSVRRSPLAAMSSSPGFRAVPAAPVTSAPVTSASSASASVAAASVSVLPAAPMAGNPQPDYPLFARQRRLQGRTVLRVEVTADGRPGSVVVLRSSGQDMLDKAAADRVREAWRFRPATRGGTAIASTVDIPVVFRLTE